MISFRDPRQFGRILLRAREQLFSEPPWSELGPDAWSPGLSAALLAKRLAGHKRSIKDVLMDQRVLSGLGTFRLPTRYFWQAFARAAAPILSRATMWLAWRARSGVPCAARWR